MKTITAPGLAAACLLMAAAAQPVAAQDEGLYPEPASPDASYIRVLAPGGGAVRIDGDDARTGDAGTTAYYEVMPGTLSITADGKTSDVEIGPSAVYTYVVNDGETKLLEDPEDEGAGDAELTLYNLTSLDTFDLYAPKADAVALKDVAPHESGSVALKAPMTLDFEIRQGDETIAEVEGVELRRGTGTAIVLTGSEGDYSAVAARDSFGD